MTAIFGLLVIFLAIGIFARSFNLRIRILMGVAIIAMIVYSYLA